MRPHYIVDRNDKTLLVLGGFVHCKLQSGPGNKAMWRCSEHYTFNCWGHVHTVDKVIVEYTEHNHPPPPPPPPQRTLSHWTETDDNGPSDDDYEEGLDYNSEDGSSYDDDDGSSYGDGDGSSYDDDDGSSYDDEDEGPDCDKEKGDVKAVLPETECASETDGNAVGRLPSIDELKKFIRLTAGRDNSSTSD